jgi:hypothetical protein
MPYGVKKTTDEKKTATNKQNQISAAASGNTAQSS